MVHMVSGMLIQGAGLWGGAAVASQQLFHLARAPDHHAQGPNISFRESLIFDMETAEFAALGQTYLMEIALQ